PPRGSPWATLPRTHSRSRMSEECKFPRTFGTHRQNGKRDRRGGRAKSVNDLAENNLRLGVGYLIRARYSAFVHLTPTAGNQFHHAVEMFLKGDLADATSESERRNLGHKLSKVWKAFKDKAADSTLDQFDATVAKLDKFEDIRYPEKL